MAGEASGTIFYIDCHSKTRDPIGLTLTLHSCCMKVCFIDAYTFVIDLPLRASFPTSSFPFTSVGPLYVSQLATLTRVIGTIGMATFSPAVCLAWAH